jgi:ADP-ribose diphosphatase
MNIKALRDPCVLTGGTRKKPQILSVRTAARSRLFHIESVQLKFANGSRREFERIAAVPRPGTARCCNALDPATVLLVREYAVGLDRFELTLPMGRIERGESACN